MNGSSVSLRSSWLPVVSGVGLPTLPGVGGGLRGGGVGGGEEPVDPGHGFVKPVGDRSQVGEGQADDAGVWWGGGGSGVGGAALAARAGAEAVDADDARLWGRGGVVAGDDTAEGEPDHVDLDQSARVGHGLDVGDGVRPAEPLRVTGAAPTTHV